MIVTNSFVQTHKNACSYTCLSNLIQRNVLKDKVFMINQEQEVNLIKKESGYSVKFLYNSHVSTYLHKIFLKQIFELVSRPPKLNNFVVFLIGFKYAYHHRNYLYFYNINNIAYYILSEPTKQECQIFKKQELLEFLQAKEITDIGVIIEKDNITNFVIKEFIKDKQGLIFN